MTKENRFLDRVVKLFLSQCEIVYGTSDKYSGYIKTDFYVKTPYSDHGCTLPYGQMNAAFYKYLMNNYGMTYEETIPAWEIIKKELQKRIDNYEG